MLDGFVLSIFDVLSNIADAVSEMLESVEIPVSLDLSSVFGFLSTSDTSSISGSTTIFENSALVSGALAVICLIAATMAIVSGVDAYLRAARTTINPFHVRIASILKQDFKAGLGKQLQTLDARVRLPFIRVIAARMRSAQKKRDNEEIVRHLPHMIDAITLSVAAGLSFDQALATYVEKTEGLLAHHFKQALQFWQTGLKLRGEALDDMVSELESREVARFVSALQQSLVLGTALVYVLEAQASEARDAHKQYLETKIAKTPVKMLLPTATCIVPSLLLLMLGPVVIDVIEGLGGGL
jgi:hypothetical protein